MTSEYDQKIIDGARTLAALVTTADAAAYFTARDGADDICAQNPLAAFFGRGTVTLGQLLAIIDQQADQITNLSAEAAHLADLLDEAESMNADV